VEVRCYKITLMECREFRPRIFQGLEDIFLRMTTFRPGFYSKAHLMTVLFGQGDNTLLI
jgi:hypothetical protein